MVIALCMKDLPIRRMYIGELTTKGHGSLLWEAVHGRIGMSADLTLHSRVRQDRHEHKSDAALGPGIRFAHRPKDVIAKLVLKIIEAIPGRRTTTIKFALWSTSRERDLPCAGIATRGTSQQHWVSNAYLLLICWQKLNVRGPVYGQQRTTRLCIKTDPIHCDGIVVWVPSRYHRQVVQACVV